MSYNTHHQCFDCSLWSIQRKAAELISKKPVVVMSGRGGCGKTEVVSRVCQVALEKIYQQKKKEHDDYVRKLIHKAIGK